MEELDLVDVARSGLRLEVLRELTPSDVATMPSPGAKAPVVARLRHTHHLAARLLAEGKPNYEVCAITGYSPSRISILKGDPAFGELVQYYKAQVQAAYLNVHERLAAFGISCLEELQERLEASPNDFTLNQLREMVEMTMDRSVAPKKGASAPLGGPGTGVTINVQFKEPAQGAGLVIEHEPTHS